MRSPHPVLLNHLSIQTGASLTLGFEFTGNESPLPECLPKTLGNLKNVFSATSVSLRFGKVKKCVQLHGPNGILRILSDWIGQNEAASFLLNNRIIRSLTCFDLSGIKRLVITEYKPPPKDETNESTTCYILHRMEELRTLTLTHCENLPFFAALNPAQTPSKRVLCPKLEELILYVEEPKSLNIEELTIMAMKRAVGGTKLSTITIVGLDEIVLGPLAYMLKLMQYATRVDSRTGEKPPKWNSIPELGDN